MEMAEDAGRLVKCLVVEAGVVGVVGVLVERRNRVGGDITALLKRAWRQCPCSWVQVLVSGAVGRPS